MQLAGFFALYLFQKMEESRRSFIKKVELMGLALLTNPIFMVNINHP